MCKFLVVLVAILASSSAGQQKFSFVAGLATHSKHLEGKRYSSGAELSSLAHSSALQATDAVQNQQSASFQAIAGANLGYTQAAKKAAAAAEAAVVANQAIVEHIQENIADTERYLQQEELLYRQSVEAAEAARNLGQQSQQQQTAFAAAIAAMQQSTNQNQQVATTAAQAAAAQQQMIQDGRQRLGRLHSQLDEALVELQKTQRAAQKAAAAAHAAQNNAGASAQLAVVNTATNHIGGRGHGYYL